MKRLRVAPSPIIDRSQLDRFVIDTVLKTLYNNADIDTLHLINDIYKPHGIKLSHKESERLWSVMIASGWINAVIGFGNSGKVALTREGYQLMAQYGGYAEYLAAINDNQQTLILPFQVNEEQNKQESAVIQQKAPKPENNDDNQS